jgi:hypothetical protein
MKKLKLMLDALAVDTFATVKPVEQRGTVVGQENSSTSALSCDPDVCVLSEDHSCVCTETKGCPEATSYGETC